MRYIQDKYFYHKLSCIPYAEYEMQKCTPEKAARCAKASVAFQEALVFKKEKIWAYDRRSDWNLELKGIC